LTPRSWDVFCRVVDNFGDAAVCWRLARGLAALDPPPTVRLWIDHLDVLRALVPELSPEPSRQAWDGVQVLRLNEEADFGTPADVAVDAFGCGLPDAYVHAMAARSLEYGARPLWVLLEYLSAEPWVAAHHGLPSPHPRLPLERYFFFPGFDAQTGGLLREPGLDARRQAFLADPEQPAALWRDAGFDPPAGKLVTLFGYENAPVDALLDAWVRGAEPVVAAVPASRLEPGVAAFMGAAGTDANVLTGRSHRRGSLEVRFLPFLPQERYDELLWSAHWNFVRGEDSFVRAQWAERPFVWQLYPQAENAHIAKLEAFLELYCSGLDAALAAPLRSLFRAWNGAPGSGGADLELAWASLTRSEDELRRHARRWASQLVAAGDLVMKLAKFCSERLK